MKKKNLFFGGLLLCAMTFGTVALTACGDDDKENEEVVDPLETEKEYYIVGTVTAANGILAGAKVDAGNDLTAVTDAQGIYMLTVKETGEYNLKFTATDMESMESKVTIATSAANRTQTTLNVKMVKAISFDNAEEVTVEADKETTVEAAQNETATEEPTTVTTVSVPAQAAEEGTTIAAVAYEEPKASTTEEVAETPKEEAVPVTAVAIKVTPEDAVAKAPIEIKTAVTGTASTGSYFDPEAMEALKDAAITRAAVHFGGVTYKDGNYVITIPEGEKIQGKYLTNILPSKTASKVQQGEYNAVNGEESVIKIENRDYSALNATLKVTTKCGWDYTTTPEAALQAVGASKELASVIEKCISHAEGSKNGYYTVDKELKTAISGNNQLIFGSRSKIQTKTYTFPVFVNGIKKQVVVTLNCYMGYTEEYSNTPIDKHSGGTTGK